MISRLTIRRLVLISTITTLVSLGLMVMGIVFPKPILLVLAMSLGQLFGTLSLALYLLAIVLDLQGVGEHDDIAPAHRVRGRARRRRRAEEQLRRLAGLDGGRSRSVGGRRVPDARRRFGRRTGATPWTVPSRGTLALTPRTVGLLLMSDHARGTYSEGWDGHPGDRGRGRRGGREAHRAGPHDARLRGVRHGRDRRGRRRARAPRAARRRAHRPRPAEDERRGRHRHDPPRAAEDRLHRAHRRRHPGARARRDARGRRRATS